ncbi:hypothetical protein P7K49_021050, partial [Saguinus oedipus]
CGENKSRGQGELALEQNWEPVDLEARSTSDTDGPKPFPGLNEEAEPTRDDNCFGATVM